MATRVDVLGNVRPLAVVEGKAACRELAPAGTASVAEGPHPLPSTYRSNASHTPISTRGRRSTRRGETVPSHIAPRSRGSYPQPGAPAPHLPYPDPLDLPDPPDLSGLAVGVHILTIKMRPRYRDSRERTQDRCDSGH